MNGYISTCMFLLYSIGNKMCVAQDTRNVTFCETEDNLKINCPKNTTIAVQFLTTAQNGETNNDKCLGHFNLLLGDQCSGITNCIVSAMEYFLSSCRMIPKFIKATYTCYCFYWFFPSHFSMYADLSEINCDNHCFFGGILEINNIQVDEGICANCAINEVKTSVSKLCNKKKKCSSPQNDDYCLFHPRYVRIHYSCQEEKNGTSIFPERTTESKTTTEALNWTVSNYSTNYTVKERTTCIYVYNTQETSAVTVGTTVSLDTKPVVQLDMQGRVLIFDPMANTTFTVCSNHWYDDDANVLCNNLNKSSYGIASQLLKQHPYTTVELKFQCTGNETSLFDCNSTFIGFACNISTVAAAICCPDDDSSECSSNTQPKSNTMPSTELNKGVVIGIVLGVLLIACAVVLIVVFIRRAIGPKKKNEDQNCDISMNDYTGTQDIEMPMAYDHRSPYLGLEMETRNSQYQDISDMNNASNKNISDPSKYTKLNNKNNNFSDQRSHNDSAILDQTKGMAFVSNSKSTVNNYLVLDPNETGFSRSEGPEKTIGSYELAKPIHRIDLSKDDERKRRTSNDVYAHSEEGIYDSSNGNRRKESENNVYSHAVDNVYDSSSHTRKNAETENNYDHFSDKKTDDDYDISQLNI